MDIYTYMTYYEPLYKIYKDACISLDFYGFFSLLDTMDLIPTKDLFL